MAEPELNNSMPTSLVLARLGEFFGHRTPWHRRLWNVGTNLALHEVIEYADATTWPQRARRLRRTVRTSSTAMSIASSSERSEFSTFAASSALTRRVKYSQAD